MTHLMLGLDFADDEHDVRFEVVVEQVTAAGFEVRFPGQGIAVHRGQEADKSGGRITQSKDGRHPFPGGRQATRLSRTRVQGDQTNTACVRGQHLQQRQTNTANVRHDRRRSTSPVFSPSVLLCGDIASAFRLIS